MYFPIGFLIYNLIVTSDNWGIGKVRKSIWVSGPDTLQVFKNTYRVNDKI